MPKLIINKPVKLLFDGEQVDCQVTGAHFGWAEDFYSHESKVPASITITGLFTTEQLSALMGEGVHEQ